MKFPQAIWTLSFALLQMGKTGMANGAASEARSGSLKQMMGIILASLAI